MAQSEFRPASKLLPALLAKLAKQSGRAVGLGPVWAEAAGEIFRTTCQPVRVEGETLIVAAPDKSWNARVEEHAVEIGRRLSEATSGQLRSVRSEVASSR